MQPAEQILNGHVQERSLLDQIADEQARIGARYMPTLSVKQFTEREKLLRELKDMLVDGVDYGVIPGTQKPTLLLPGAQKICTFFGYVPHYAETAIEAWTPDQYGEPLFYYKYTCCLYKNSEAVGEGIGSASNWESKYRYRWMRADQLPAGTEVANLVSRGGKQTLFVYEFALEKAETTGQYGKPAEYWQQFQDAITARTARKVNKPFKSGKEGWGWEIDIDSMQYRVPNSDFADIINTCQKMGQKRSYIAATLSATGASQYFTQDLEDMEHIDTGGHPKGTQEAADHVAQRKIADAKNSGPQAQAGPSDPASASEGRGESAPTAPLSSPELEALMKRCVNIKEFEMLCGELLDIIGQEYDQATRTKVWRDAVAQAGGGNVSANRSKWLPVVKFINDVASVIASEPKQEVA